ncbi:MAG: hypothetical protein QOC77_3146 [Thermoleophilaceae bacterium]|nr:hypothetical protein [Thermoleophilaceae bacterium]
MIRLSTPRVGTRGTKTKTPTRMRSRRALATVGGATALCGALLAAPAALADVSASSPGNLAVSISTPGPVLAGVSTPYTMTVTNNTPYDFPGSPPDTIAQGTMSTGFRLDSFSGPAFCERFNTNSKGVLRGPAFSCEWSGPLNPAFSPLTLAPGETASWTINATAAKPGTEAIHVTATGIFAETTPLGLGVSNAVDLSVPVGQGPVAGGGGGGVPAPTGLPDLALTGSASSGSPALGSPFSYKFQVKNNGKSDASGATLDDPLPTSVAGTSVSTDTGTCSIDSTANSVHCDLGTMAAGKQANVTVNAIAPSSAGAVTNTASSGLVGTDANSANNSASVTVQPK